MSGRLVRILSTPDVFEGVIVRSRLEDEGIPVMTSGDDSPYPVGPVHVFVPIEYEVQARLVIETLREGGPAAAEAAFEADRLEDDPRGDERPGRDRREDASDGSDVDGAEREERA